MLMFQKVAVSSSQTETGDLEPIFAYATDLEQAQVESLEEALVSTRQALAAAREDHNKVCGSTPLLRA